MQTKNAILTLANMEEKKHHKSNHEKYDVKRRAKMIRVNKSVRLYYYFPYDRFKYLIYTHVINIITVALI